MSDDPFLRRQAAAAGAVGLACEALWTKGLALSLGSGGAAQVLVLASQLSGLAAGAWWLGRRAEAARDPMRFLGNLQLAGAGLVAASLPAMMMLTLLPERGRGVAAAAIVFACAAAIGGVLPALARCSGGDARVLARLGGANALGAGLGALASSVLLVPALGLAGALLGAAGIWAAAGWDARARSGEPAPP